MKQAVKSMFTDIIVFPKIGKSYAIKTSLSRTSLNPLSEWNLFGWKGHRIGSYCENYSGGGYLYLWAPSCAGTFDESTQIVMPSLKTAVAYAWLKTHQLLLEYAHRKNKTLSLNEKWLSIQGVTVKRYGISAFTGGPHEQTIFSLFNSKDKLIGCIDQTDYELVGKIATAFGYEDLIHQLANETQEAILERLMKILRRK